MLETPSYHRYYNKTYKIIRTDEGRLRGYLLSLTTGNFEENNDVFDEVVWATSSSDISVIGEEDFVEQTEAARARYLRGAGPIFALYETVDGISEQRKREDRRRFTSEERALIKSLRRRTFQMWEEEFARLAAGEPPTFEYTSTMM